MAWDSRAGEALARLERDVLRRTPGMNPSAPIEDEQDSDAHRYDRDLVAPRSFGLVVLDTWVSSSWSTAHRSSLIVRSTFLFLRGIEGPSFYVLSSRACTADA